MLTKDQVEIAIQQLTKVTGWTEERSREKLDEFLAVKAAIDFAAEIKTTSIDEIRARMQREGMMNPYRSWPP